MRELLKDEQGIDTIPLKLIIYLVIIGLIMGITAIGLERITPPMDALVMERQMSHVISSIKGMQSGYARDLADPQAPAGSIRTVDLILPQNLEYLSFGVDPDPDNNGILTDTPPGLVTDDGDVIYYKLKNGGKKLIRLDGSVHIREGIYSNGRWIPNTVNRLAQAVVLTGGSQSVTFELVHESGVIFTLAHLTDGVDAYINTGGMAGLPYGIQVRSNPGSIPADGITVARVMIQVIDNEGKRIPLDDQPVTLTSTLGDLSRGSLITDSYGKGEVLITSEEPGLGVVITSSPGLHDGVGEIAFTQPSVVVEFNERITSSHGKRGTSELLAEFQTSHNATYDVTLTGWGTEFRVGRWLVRWPVCRIEVDGMIMGDREVASRSRIEVSYGKIELDAGTHHLKVTMPTDLRAPFFGDINLYVEKIKLS